MLLSLCASRCTPSKQALHEAAAVATVDGGAAKVQESADSDDAAKLASPTRSPEDLCRSLSGLEPPVSDRPSADQKQALKPGDAKRYYYGIGVGKDYVKARHAAFLELDERYGGWFAGNPILMMLYANGLGVERNANFATKLACAEGGAPAEMSGRVEHLQNLPEHAQLPPFDFCDDATSGMTMGACETLATERELPEIDARIEAAASAWPEDQKAALATLRARGDAFWELHASGEVDLAGTDRDGVRARAKLEQLKVLSSVLEGFARAPNVDSARVNLKQADADLNKAYKEALAKDLSYTTINAEGIPVTEKAWLKYRDAWAALGTLRYPAVKADAWKAWLSQERTKQLAEIGN